METRYGHKKKEEASINYIRKLISESKHKNATTLLNNKIQLNTN